MSFGEADKNTTEEKKFHLEHQLEAKKILVVDDQTLNLRITTRILEKAGCFVGIANDGKNAVEVFEASDIDGFDAILMDVRMPVMDGLEACRIIRSLDRADAKTIPIIAVSANECDEDIQESLAAGMNAHLMKPINPEMLYLTLVEWITTSHTDL